MSAHSSFRKLYSRSLYLFTCALQVDELSSPATEDFKSEKQAAATEEWQKPRAISHVVSFKVEEQSGTGMPRVTYSILCFACSAVSVKLHRVRSDGV